MNRIIWKELVEQRYIPFAYAVLLTVILIIGDVMGNWIATHGGNADDRMSMNNALTILGGGLLLTGLFPGSTTIANEAAQGTIGFLSAIPIGRSKIWLGKVIAGVMIMVTSAFFMLVVFVVITVIEFHGEAFVAIDKVVPFNHSSPGIILLLGIYGVLLFVFVSLYSYSISLFCSTITDRPLAAAGLALCIGLVLVVGLGWLPFDQSVALEIGITVAIPAFLLASWLSFCTSARQDAAEHRMIALKTGSVMLIASLVATGIYFYLQFLVQLTFPALSTPYYPIPMSFLPPNNRVGLTSYWVDYGRAKIGKAYSGQLVVGNSWQADGTPVTLQSSSTSLSGHIESQKVFVTQVRNYGKHTMRTVYDVVYTYRPLLPYGDEVLTLNALSSDGKVIGTIHIYAHKPFGYFPPRHWFPGLIRQEQYDSVDIPGGNKGE